MEGIQCSKFDNNFSSPTEKPPKKEYKSPFERKKEAEIRRLDKKVDETSANNKQEQQLMEMQYSLREQELTNIKEEIRYVKGWRVGSISVHF